jgi:hypothetical protein
MSANNQPYSEAQKAMIQKFNAHCCEGPSSFAAPTGFGRTVNNTKTMRNERLGEIAYNAYCAARGWKSVRGEPLPHWQQQDDTLRAAWCDAAEAVAKDISNQTGRG